MTKSQTGAGHGPTSWRTWRPGPGVGTAESGSVREEDSENECVVPASVSLKNCSFLKLYNNYLNYLKLR